MKGAPQSITLTPAGYDLLIESAKQEIADRAMGGVDVDELQLMDLSTCANFLGIPLERAAKVLPYVELGPRTRRVAVADYKAYLEGHKKYPKGCKPKDKPAPALSIVQPT